VAISRSFIPTFKVAQSDTLSRPQIPSGSVGSERRKMKVFGILILVLVLLNGHGRAEAASAKDQRRSK
jgi:hypothetical protein